MAKEGSKGLKRPWLAAVLNLIPFLGLMSWTAATLEAGAPGEGSLWVAIFIWGLGYAYLGRWLRLLFALASPWVICSVVFLAGLGDLEHQSGPEDIVPTILILGFACLFTAVDAYRLAHSHNAKLLSLAQSSPAPPETTA